MNRIHPLYRYILAFGVVVLLSLPSCREVGEIPELLDKDGITLIISEGEAYTPATKSDGQLSPVSSSTKLHLTVTECSIHTGLADTITTQTKGAPYTGNSIGTFHITAFLNSDISAPFIDKNLTSDGTAIGTGYYWPITTPESTISFFGYGKNKTTGILNISTSYVLGDDASHKGSFTYSLPDTLDSNEEHPDLVFAIAPNQKKGEDGVVPMKFYHALSSIVFTVGNVPSQIKIESVSFKNIYRKGSCEYSLSGGDVIFTWVADGETEDYLQTFSKEIGSAAEDAAINETSQTFIMIPQQFDTETSKISIVISFDGRQYTIEKPLKTFISSWEAGKEYKFKISSPEEVNIIVDDEIDTSGEYPIKKNLTITNTGISPVYVRAAIVGNWVMPNGEIIASWHVENEVNGTGYGVFDWGQASNADSQEPSLPDQTTTNWCKYEGYYYYLKPVPAGEMTDTPLFNTYTLTKFYPQNNAELELIIAVQALHPDDIGLWPESVRNKLN